MSSGGRVCRNQKCFFLKNDPACEIREKDGGAWALMVPAFGRSFSLDFFFLLLKSCAPLVAVGAVYVGHERSIKRLN